MRTTNERPSPPHLTCCPHPHADVPYPCTQPDLLQYPQLEQR